MAKRSTGLSEKPKDVRERERKCMDLANKGHTYQEIADAVGYSDDESARQAVLRCMERSIVRDVEELRHRELSRLDGMLAAAYSKAERGDEKAIDAVLKIMTRRAKYVGGLEAPPQLAVDLHDSTEERLSAALAILSQLDQGESE